MNFKDEIKYLDNLSYKSIEEVYEKHNNAILNSEKIFSRNFNLKKLNFNFKKLKFFLDTNIDFIQYNFFFHLNYKLNYIKNGDLNLQQRDSIENFYLNNLSSKCYLLNVKKNKTCYTYQHTLLYSLLIDSDVIFYDIIDYFDYTHNIFSFFLFIFLNYNFNHIHDTIEYILLYTKKGNILFETLNKFINDKNCFKDELFENQIFSTIFSKYNEIISIQNNLQNF